MYLKFTFEFMEQVEKLHMEVCTIYMNRLYFILFLQGEKENINVYAREKTKTMT